MSKMLRYLKKLLHICNHDWVLVQGLVPASTGPYKTHTERLTNGDMAIWGWFCHKCKAQRPATAADAAEIDSIDAMDFARKHGL